MTQNGTSIAGPFWTNNLSVNSRLLPFMEGTNVFNAMNMDLKDSSPQNTTTCGLLIAGFVCPSDPNTKAFNDGGTVFGAGNYGFCASADWYVFSWPNASIAGAGTPARGAFAVNQARRLSEFTDGLSGTAVMAEIRSYQPSMKCPTLLSVTSTGPAGASRPRRPAAGRLHGRLRQDRRRQALALEQRGRLPFRLHGRVYPEQEDPGGRPRGHCVHLPSGGGSGGKMTIDTWSGNENDGGANGVTFAAFPPRAITPAA